MPSLGFWALTGYVSFCCGRGFTHPPLPPRLGGLLKCQTHGFVSRGVLFWPNKEHCSDWWWIPTQTSAYVTGQVTMSSANHCCLSSTKQDVLWALHLSTVRIWAQRGRQTQELSFCCKNGNCLLLIRAFFPLVVCYSQEWFPVNLDLACFWSISHLRLMKMMQILKYFKTGQLL